MPMGTRERRGMRATIIVEKGEWSQVGRRKNARRR